MDADLNATGECFDAEVSLKLPNMSSKTLIFQRQVINAFSDEYQGCNLDVLPTSIFVVITNRDKERQQAVEKRNKKLIEVSIQYDISDNMALYVSNQSLYSEIQTCFEQFGNIIQSCNVNSHHS